MHRLQSTTLPVKPYGNSRFHDPAKALSAMSFDYVLFNKKPRSVDGALEPALLRSAISEWSRFAPMLYNDESFSLFLVPGDKDVKTKELTALYSRETELPTELCTLTK